MASRKFKMVKSHNDVLKYIGIDNIFLTGSIRTFCHIIAFDLSSGKWNVTLDKETSEKEAILNIRKKERYVEIPVVLEHVELNEYNLIIGKPEENAEIIEEINLKIRELEDNHSLWEKRREERFPVGIASSLLFNLKSPEQKVVSGRKEFPCLINNVSFSGLNFTTITIENDFKTGNDVGIVLRFQSPIETIPLKGHIQAVKIKSSAEKKRRFQFAIVSVQLIDTPLSYRKRIEEFIERTEA